MIDFYGVGWWAGLKVTRIFGVRSKKLYLCSRSNKAWEKINGGGPHLLI